jgi:glycosyltransferase involved in cell wall biosynthesis
VKNVAFLTTIFPMKEQYLIDFFDSLSGQIYDNFDVIVVNDGYKNFYDVKMKYQNLSIVELPYSDTPAKNREYGINYCIDNKYDILIFGDSDDYFSDNRIEESLKCLETFDIVVNDLNLFDKNGMYEEKYISNRLSHGSEVKLDYIQDKNIFGLSNTAIKTNILNSVEFDKDLVVVDWYLYKKLLKDGCNSIFTNKATTYYRQYDFNTIGLQVVKGVYYLWWEQIDRGAK